MDAAVIALTGAIITTNYLASAGPDRRAEHRAIRGDDVCTESDVRPYGCAPRAPPPTARSTYGVCFVITTAPRSGRSGGLPVFVVRAGRSNEPDQKVCEALDVVARAHKGGPEALKARAFAKERLMILQPRLLVGRVNDDTTTPNEILTTRLLRLV